MVGEGDRRLGAAVGGDGRARTVAGQVDDGRRAAQVFEPPGRVGVGAEAVAPLAPGGVVRVGGGPVRNRPALIRKGEVAVEDALRPPVEGDVVEGEREDVVLRREAVERGAPGWCGGEVEGGARVGGEAGVQLGFGSVLRNG